MSDLSRVPAVNALGRPVPSEDPPFFTEPTKEVAFRREGVAVFDLLPRKVALDLLVEIQAVYPPSDAPMTYANVDPDRTFMRALRHLTEPVWDRHLLPLFPNHRVAFTTCVVKHPTRASVMDAHDDGTFVDERRFRSVTVWTALTDCLPDDDAGMITVLRGSHHLARNPAGANVIDWHRPYRRFLTEHLEPLPTSAGQGVAWESRVLHGSTPNRSGRPRFAVVAELVPKESMLVQVQGLGRTRRRMLRVDEDFHIEHSPIEVRHRMPDYPELERFEDDPVAVSPAELAALCGVAPDGQDPLRPWDDWFSEDGTDPPPAPADAQLLARIEALTEVAVSEVGRLLTEGWEPTAEGSPWPDAHRSGGALLVQLPAHDGTLAGVTSAARGLLGSDRSVHLLVLPPNAAVSPPMGPTAGSVLLVPLITPGGDAGVATRGGSRLFSLGSAVVVDPAHPHQLWNDGHEEFRALVIDLPRSAVVAYPGRKRRRGADAGT